MNLFNFLRIYSNLHCLSVRLNIQPNSKLTFQISACSELFTLNQQENTQKLNDTTDANRDDHVMYCNHYVLMSFHISVRQQQNWLVFYVRAHPFLYRFYFQITSSSKTENTNDNEPNESSSEDSNDDIVPYSSIYEVKLTSQENQEHS